MINILLISVVVPSATDDQVRGFFRDISGVARNGGFLIDRLISVIITIHIFVIIINFTYHFTIVLVNDKGGALFGRGAQ